MGLRIETEGKESIRASGILVIDEDDFQVAKFFYRGRRHGHGDALTLANQFIAAVEEKPERIMSGPYSEEMWDEINSARTVEDLRYALYFVCCRLQQLESRFSGKDS